MVRGFENDLNSGAFHVKLSVCLAQLVIGCMIILNANLFHQFYNDFSPSIGMQELLLGMGKHSMMGHASTP